MMAKENPNWFIQVLTVDDTEVLTPEDIQEEREEGMSEEMIQQEYFCSYEVGLLGAFYTKQLAEAEERIKDIPYNNEFQVDIWMDIGRSDDTSIGYTQKIANEIRIIDHDAWHGEAVDFYIKLLKDKPYKYGIMGLPHDAFAKRMESRRSIAEQFSDAGFKVMRIPDHEIENGIQNVRKLFPKFWFDKTKTKKLRRSLENYHRLYDSVKKVFRKEPDHDWSSHDADMFRYLAIGMDLNYKIQSDPISMMTGKENESTRDFDIFEEKQEKIFTF
jgi:hypothetical protein